MPIYSYECVTHGEFVELRQVSLRNENTHCPKCKQLAARSVTAPNLSIMTSANRKAWQRNEKSMHEPRRHVHHHSHNCSHQTHGAQDNNTKQSHAQLVTAKRNTRPWMLGH